MEKNHANFLNQNTYLMKKLLKECNMNGNKNVQLEWVAKLQCLDDFNDNI